MHLLPMSALRRSPWLRAEVAVGVEVSDSVLKFDEARKHVESSTQLYSEGTPPIHVAVVRGTAGHLFA